MLGRSIKQFDRLGSTIKEAQASTGNITAFQKLRRDLSAAEAAFQQARDRLATLRREMQKTARPTHQMRASLAEAHKEVHTLGQRLDQQRQALMQQRRAMRAAGQSTAGLTAQKKRLANTVGQLRRQYDRLGEALNRLGVSLGSVLLPSVNSILEGLGSATNGLVTLTEKFPLASKVVIGFTTGLIAMKVAAIGLAYAGTFVLGGFFNVVTVFRTLGAGVMLARAQLTAFNAVALITATRARTLAIGSAIKGFGAALAAFAGRAVPVAIGALRALTVAFMSNPVGLAIGGIALAAGLLVTFWRPIKGFFSNLWSRSLSDLISSNLVTY